MWWNLVNLESKFAVVVIVVLPQVHRAWQCEGVHCNGVCPAVHAVTGGTTQQGECHLGWHVCSWVQLGKRGGQWKDLAGNGRGGGNNVPTPKTALRFPSMVGKWLSLLTHTHTHTRTHTPHNHTRTFHTTTHTHTKFTHTCRPTRQRMRSMLRLKLS